MEITSTPYEDPEHGYSAFAGFIKDSIINLGKAGVGIFTTNAKDLFKDYLGNLPVEHQQHYNCHACAHFIDTYGGLATIDDKCKIESVFWNYATYHISSQFFRSSIQAMSDSICKASITGVFYPRYKILGQSETNGWSHLHATTDFKTPYERNDKSANALMAEKREEFLMLLRAVQEFNVGTAQRAVSILKSSMLYRSEKVIGNAEWFEHIMVTLSNSMKSNIKRNFLWKTVEKAPVGFCHINSGMIGTLLKDIKDGLDINIIKKKFDKKMDPTIYQSPSAAPSNANIESAEKMIEKYSLGTALERRPATIDEIVKFWEPIKVIKPEGSIFSHLKDDDKPKNRTDNVKPVDTIWRDFKKDVLPNLASMTYNVSFTKIYIISLVTATHADAPPIFQWDNEEQRNPFSWYTYVHGSRASDYNLATGTDVNVVALCDKPNQWYSDKYKNQGEGVLVILEGAKDLRSKGKGIALFPEMLKSEFHPIRKTIGAYSSSKDFDKAEGPTANGVLIDDKPSAIDVVLNCTDKNGLMIRYRIAHW